MNLYLIRHGETDWNVEGRIMGNKDIPLNKTGMEQSLKAAVYLKDKKITRIICSPVLRARQTAEIISNTMNIPIESDEKLSEIGFGDWVGKIYDELKREPGFRTYYDFPGERIIPGGEIFEEAHKRIADIFDETIESKQEMAIVTHADPIKLFILHTLKCDLGSAGRIRIDNASITCVQYKDRPVLRFSNRIP